MTDPIEALITSENKYISEFIPGYSENYYFAHTHKVGVRI